MRLGISSMFIVHCSLFIEKPSINLLLPQWEYWLIVAISPNSINRACLSLPPLEHFAFIGN